MKGVNKDEENDVVERSSVKDRKNLDENASQKNDVEHKIRIKRNQYEKGNISLRSSFEFLS